MITKLALFIAFALVVAPINSYTFAQEKNTAPTSLTESKSDPYKILGGIWSGRIDVPTNWWPGYEGWIFFTRFSPTKEYGRYAAEEEKYEIVSTAILKHPRHLFTTLDKVLKRCITFYQWYGFKAYDPKHCESDGIDEYEED